MYSDFWNPTRRCCSPIPICRIFRNIFVHALRGFEIIRRFEHSPARVYDYKPFKNTAVNYTEFRQYGFIAVFRIIEKLLDCKVYLDLYVKVRNDWQNNDAMLGSTGLGKDIDE